jgi:hypothetical protein
LSQESIAARFSSVTAIQQVVVGAQGLNDSTTQTTKG